MATTSADRRFGINSGAAVKVPCKAATTANITLSGEQTIDGVSCTTGDRVLVKDQTTTSENGIYVVDSSSWERAKDWDGSLDVKKGTFVYVHSGSTNVGFWYVSTSDTITPGTTSVSIDRASSMLAIISAFAQTLLDDADAAAALTTLGVSAYIQTLLDDANAAAALTTLGVSSFAQTILDDTSADIARATIGAVGLTGDESVAGNKTHSGNNTFSGDNDIKDTLEIYDPSDTTKKIRFDAGGVSTATTRVVTVPDYDMTLADRAYIKVSDVKASTTAGGTNSAATWNTRTINTEDTDTAGLCSISSNQITLAAGTYECRITAPALRVDKHKLRLRNITDTATTLVGMSCFSANTDNTATQATLSGRFTVAAQKTFEVQHYTQTAVATYGLGVDTASGESEVYAVAEFWRVG